MHASEARTLSTPLTSQRFDGYSATHVGLKFETADPVDGVVVEAPALQEPIERAGIASELEALVALHQKGALTDGEFAAAKAKLLG